MKKFLSRVIESDTFGAVALALFATFAFGLIFFAAMPVHAQGEGTGTLPVIEKQSTELSAGTTWTITADGRVLVITSTDGGANECAQSGSGGVASVHHMSWRSKYTSHDLTVTRNPGESTESFEERCAVELGVAQRHFPPDAT